MFDPLVSLLGPLLGLLLVFGPPAAFCVAGYVVGRNQRIRGERAASGLAQGAPAVPHEGPMALALPPSRRLGLVGLAVSGVACVVGITVPLAAIGGAAEHANAAVVVPGAAVGVALAVAGAALGAAGIGQRRAMWAGVFAMVVGLVAWLVSGCFLFLSTVGTGMPGRPLRAGGVPLLPRVRRGRRRPDDAPCEARITDLAHETRRALGRAWEGDARYEHASVLAFEHLARDLEVARAPRALVAWARHAAKEEVGHASCCFALASAYSGSTVRASSLPFAPSWVRRVETRSALLERLAVESLVDGCVGEGAAALGAALGAERAKDPVVKSVLERIACEEETHAGLAWAILDWLVREEPRLASVLSGRLERTEIDGVDESEPTVPGDLACHGRVSSAERRDHLARACDAAKQRLAGGMAVTGASTPFTPSRRRGAGR
jgi:hypothetical protein